MAQVTELSLNGVMGGLHTFYGKQAEFICIKSITIVVMTATSTITEMKATATGATPYASASLKCD